MSETTPLLNDGKVRQEGANDSSACANADVSNIETGTIATTVTSAQPTTGTTTPVPENNTDGVVKKQQNIPVLELLALTAIVSGSLSMYWGISGMLVGTTTASVVLTTLLSQPIILVHTIMSACVVVLAPVVTVQKVQLSAMGTLREQQNELRTQINSFNEMNDQLTKSIASIEDHTAKIEQVNTELQVVANSTGTTADRLIELCNEQQDINAQLQKHLQAKIIQQIVTITLQSDTNQNYIVSENEVNILVQRLQQIPGVVFQVDRFHQILNQSEPKGALTLTDICRIARNMQQNATPATTTTTTVEDATIEAASSYGDPVFVFQPNDLLLQA